MIEAEEYGITSANADSMKTSDNPAVKRLVGAEGELGAAFGLDNEWSLRIIKQVGNYGESYKRNICLLYTSPSPRDRTRSRMPSSA